ncbi:hypothetical protein [Paucibacter sp. XJ19-41]|uniref:hypothetical protein n=1 Tax=Paucibacter sp. XJ19-41 TaxID=2927824 RepID=UPI00234A614C|nr:hypothetical protein [Paucibacter sp. XJ19-41]MDC6170475.1 hypothetical protein [Paucibacter sp. XJ19-41]
MSHKSEKRRVGGLLGLQGLRGLAAAVLGWGLCAAAQAAPPTIGAIVPKSWPSAAQGEEIHKGMLLALKTSSIQPVPTLLVQDSGCDYRRAEAAAKQLIEAKVDVVLGGWCVLGGVPALLKTAGVPLVSSNAERYLLDAHVLQLGRVGPRVGESVAATLRRETGLRVSASSSCWMDFEAAGSEKFDAVLCPTLVIDQARWAQVEGLYTAAFLKPFTVSAARGYAAMEVGLSYLRKLRSGAKPAVALAEAQTIQTLLGPVPAPDAATPAAAMQLLLTAKLPRLAPKESAQLNAMLKAKSCACKPGCSEGEAKWRELPVVLASCAGGKPVAVGNT